MRTEPIISSCENSLFLLKIYPKRSIFNDWIPLTALIACRCFLRKMTCSRPLLQRSKIRRDLDDGITDIHGRSIGSRLYS